MWEEPIFFASAFEALFDRTLRGRLTPQLQGRLRAAGVDLAGPLKAAYPFKVWEDVVAAVARELHPEVAEREAWFLLGLDFVNGYSATLIGKAALALARLVGFDRTLQRFTTQLRNINNAAEGVVELSAPGRALLRVRLLERFRGKLHPAPPPAAHYVRGVLLGMLMELGKTDARVAVVTARPAERDTLYELTWAED